VPLAAQAGGHENKFAPSVGSTPASARRTAYTAGVRVTLRFAFIGALLFVA